MIRLVNMTLYDGLQSRASDIHLESDEEGLLIRYRIDGAMLTIRKVPGQLTANQVMSRLKVLSSLDIAEKRAAGWTLQGRAAGPRGGFPRVHHAGQPRRERGAAPVGPLAEGRTPEPGWPGLSGVDRAHRATQLPMA